MIDPNNDIPWQYTDTNRTVVMRTNHDGSMESYMVSIQQIQDWIVANGQPLAASV